MTLKDARELKAYIHSLYSINCTVPLGCGPDRYFPCSVLAAGPHNWTSKQEFRDWLAKRKREDRRKLREYHQLARRRARSPIELMVDRACGLV